MLRLLLFIIGLSWGISALWAGSATAVQTQQGQEQLCILMDREAQLHSSLGENIPSENPYLYRSNNRNLRRSSSFASFLQKNWIEANLSSEDLLQLGEYHARVLFLGKSIPVFFPALHPVAKAIHRYYLF
jgi:hypothetical protein